MPTQGLFDAKLGRPTRCVDAVRDAIPSFVELGTLNDPFRSSEDFEDRRVQTSAQFMTVKPPNPRDTPTP
jgi:hypothetical protein